MKNKKLIKLLLIIAITGIIIGGATVLYMFNMPHRDVSSTNADYSLTATQLVAEYLNNSATANEKYLSDDGESKVLEISGTVADINEDYNGQTVVLLKESKDKAGVSCTFSTEDSQQTIRINISQQIKIKGVIRSGASYDEDLEMYENVVLDKSSIISR